jgi:hypothetical protein
MSLANYQINGLRIDNMFNKTFNTNFVASNFISNLFLPSMSETGQYAVACVYNGKIYYSSDYGLSWTISDSITSFYWQKISMSATGQYCVACSRVTASGKLYYSSTYGQNWTVANQPLNLATANWNSVSISGNGQYAVACVRAVNGKIYYSNNRGESWTVSNSITQYWNFVSMSYTGQYAIAVYYTTPYYSNDYGMSWTEGVISFPLTNDGSGSNNWKWGMISGTGQYGIVVGGRNLPYYSNDYGKSWTMSLSTYLYPIVNEPTSMTMSASGQYALFVNYEGIHYSGDFGVTWKFMMSQIKDSHSIAISGDARYTLIAYGGGLARIYYSVNNIGYFENVATNFSVAETDIGKYANPSTFSTVAGTITTCGFTTPIVQYNTGNTWNAVSSSITAGWRSVSISASGQYAVACIDASSKTYYSNNYGQTWNESNSIVTFWRSVSISASGQYAIAGVNGGQLYYSNSFGVNWTVNATSPSLATSDWFTVSISASGQYAIACQNVTSVGKMYFSNNYGVTWTESYSVGGIWNTCSMSASGQYAVACIQTAGQLYHSNDYGQTWIVATQPSGVTSADWRAVSISASGQYAIAGVGVGSTGGKLYYSNAYGRSWTEATQPSGVTTALWFVCSISASGQYAIACDNNTSGKIYYSSNYGQSWNASDSIATTWRSVSMSASGQYAIAGIFGTSVTGKIHRSVNTSTTTVSQDLTTVFEPLYKYVRWSSTDSARSWTGISCSNNGRYVVACTLSGGLIRYSSDYGVSWATATINNPTASPDWFSISMSNSGKYAVACQNLGTGRIYYSSDSGANWTLSTSSVTGWWLSIAISSSGRYAIANKDFGASNGTIYYSNDFGANWTASNLTTAYCPFMTMSGNGKYGIACRYRATPVSPMIYYTNNYGVTWTGSTSITANLDPVTANFSGCAMSADGKYAIVGTSSGGPIYYSNDFGVNWNASNSISANWHGASMSDSGQYCTFALGNENIAYSTDYGVNWTVTGATTGSGTNRIAISKNGQYAFLTTFAGTVRRCAANNTEPLKTYPTWTPVATPSASNKTNVAMGSNYALMCVYGGGVYISSNYGNSWSIITSTLSQTANWQCCSMSNSGQYQVVAIYSGNAYYSIDFGSTWTLSTSTPSGSLAWQSLAMSSNGDSVIALIKNFGVLIAPYNNGRMYENGYGYNDEYTSCAVSASSLSSSGQFAVFASNSLSGQGRIYYSQNSGYYAEYSTSFTNVQWRGICISSDGRTAYCAIYTGQIYKSIDFGRTFLVLSSSPTATWVSGSTDSTGQYVIYASESTIYYSSNYGSSWTAIATPSASLNWSSVVISKDGLRAIATVYGGLAYYANAIDV